jgi:hypothetical protein
VRGNTHDIRTLAAQLEAMKLERDYWINQTSFARQKLNNVNPETQAFRLAVAAKYPAMLPAIREAAERCGYSIGVHGSEARDFDLIAAPWVEHAKPAAELAEAVRAAVGGHWPAEEWDAKQNGTRKAHGREQWKIMVAGGYIDMSVMPLQIA